MLGCAAVGLALGRRRPLRVDPWALGTAVAVFAVFAAPVVLSGQATFAGYITLDDTSTFLGLTDRVMSHGRDISGLAPSTYQRVLDVNLAHGYPVGSFMPFGIGHVLVRQEGVHERLGMVSKMVTVKPGAVVTVDFDYASPEK